eukprot:COSAG02_NODE_55725_length_289_cov_0.605263_1_plen_36_part_01
MVCKFASRVGGDQSLSSSVKAEDENLVDDTEEGRET